MIVYSPDDVVAVCGNRPWECPRLELRELDLLVYELDLRHLALEVATALGFSGKPEQIDAVTWKLGPTAGRRVFVTVPFGPDGFLKVAMPLSTQPSLLLAPTQKLGSHKTVQLLEGGGSSFLALEDLLEVDDDGEFVLSRRGRLLWSASSSADEPENVFRKEGEVWTLRFSGQTVGLKHRLGLSYLRVLLGAQGQEIHMSELVAAAEHVGSDSGVPGLSGGHKVLDWEAVKSLKATLSELHDLKDEAADAHDIEQVQDLDTKIAWINSELRSASGIFGRPRRLGSEVAQERKRVTTAIRRAIADIHKEHQALGNHLSGFVQTGQYLSYKPETEVTWVIL